MVRHRFKLGNAGNPLPYALVGIVVLGLTIVWMKPEPVAAPAVAAAAPAVQFKDVQKVLEQRCFMLWINQPATPSPEMPFGGVKDSGYGSEGGPEALEAYLNTKAVSILGV